MYLIDLCIVFLIIFLLLHFSFLLYIPLSLLRLDFLLKTPDSVFNRLISFYKT